MPARAELSASQRDGAALLGRALMSAIFIWAGYGKLMSPAATQAYFAKAGVVLPPLVWIVAVVVELLGGLALLLGIQTRLVALILGLWCIATAITAHSNFADADMQIHFMKNVAMAGGFVLLAAFGGGNHTLGSLFWRSRA